MGLGSKNCGFFIRRSFLCFVLVKFRVSVFISFECKKVKGGWSRSQAWRWAGFMSSQSRGSSTSEPDDSESEYSSVEEMYGSGSRDCRGISVEGRCSVGSVSDWGSSSLV